MDVDEIRAGLLKILNRLANSDTMLQEMTVLQLAQQELRISQSSDTKTQQLFLMTWQDFFRTGYLSWGADINNHKYPWFHITEKGRKAFARPSQDPVNPNGYMQYLKSQVSINPITESYIREALATYNNECYKATAVMVGAAAESVSLELRDKVVAKVKGAGRTPSKELIGWQIKGVLEGIKKELEPHKKNMGSSLSEAFEYNWPAFTNSIRSVRNDAGHPNNIDPVTPEDVHAALLLFPKHAKLASDLMKWLDSYSSF